MHTKWLLSSCLLLLQACNNKQVVDKPKLSETQPQHVVRDSTIRIGDSVIGMEYTREEYRIIKDSFPELQNAHPASPDSTYKDSKRAIKGNTALNFNSETGQDAYYLLYTHFLRQQYRLDTFCARRQQLNDVYQIINSIYQQLQYGGTYFGHQCARIYAYVEYTVYQYAENQQFSSQGDNFIIQKRAYIASLKKMIADRERVDNNTFDPKEKLQREKEFAERVSKLDRLITDSFYLNNVRKFQQEYYNYQEP